jgi:hypothetical protein
MLLGFIGFLLISTLRPRGEVARRRLHCQINETGPGGAMTAPDSMPKQHAHPALGLL